jgi:hypothetical protein
VRHLTVLIDLTIDIEAPIDLVCVACASSATWC